MVPTTVDTMTFLNTFIIVKKKTFQFSTLTVSAILQNKVGLKGIVLNWFKTYLSNRGQRTSISGTLFRCFDLDCRLTQGSCFGPDGQVSQDVGVRKVERCVANVRSWMINDILLLNDVYDIAYPPISNFQFGS